MKKLVLLVVCGLLLCAGVFASGKREPGTKIAAISGAYQGDFYTVKGDSSTNKINLSGIALGLDSREMYTDKVGFFGHMAVNFPLAGYEVKGDKNLAVDFLFGPAFIPFETERLTLNINPGVHVCLWMADALVITAGLGADISTYCYFNDSFFLAGGVIASYDFLSFRSDDKISAFHIKPRVGLGFRW
jgi:hypothetical protein